jgi:tetratricopeptide (TPR) repeat protein
VRTPTRLVERLDLAIARADDPFRRECLKAERAAALARHGLLADARFALSGLRAQSQRHRRPILNAWVHLVDGLIDHFESLSPRAMQKFAKAHEHAVAAGDVPMQALASAWMAAVCSNCDSLAVTLHHVVDALSLAGPDCHAARARASLVLADTYRVAGDDAQAQRWYTQTRLHASAEGDGSMMSVLLHNLAAMRAARIGLDDAFGRAQLDDARQALIEIESVVNYDTGVGTDSLAAMVPVMKAQVFVVLSRFEEAVALFDAYLGRARQDGMGHREARFLADRAWSHQRCGRWPEAQRDARAAAAALAVLQDSDDRAAVEGRLAALYRAAGHEQEATQHAALAEAAWQEHLLHQQQMRQQLDAAVARIA